MYIAWSVPSANTNRAQLLIVRSGKGETAYAKYNFRVLFIIKLARDTLLFPWAASYIVVEFTILSFNFNKFVEMDYFKHICFSEISISKRNKINFCCWNSQLLCFFICLGICINLLVASEFTTFAKFTIKLLAKFTIFVKLAIFAACKGSPLVLLFALSRWLLAKLSKSPAGQCKA